MLEIYDMRTGRWSRGSDMPTARHHAGAAAVGGKLYVVGGRRGGKLSLAAVERYDPATDRWQRMAPLPLRVGGVAAVGAAGRVIAAGGGDDEEDWLTPATWALAPSRNRWQRLADLQVPRHGHSLAALDGVAYTFGGSPCPGYAATDAAEALDLR
jgi:Kelch motif